MKAMKTPKMDVVRFTESDVIVASSTVEHRYAVLANWGNNNVGDATLRFHNGHDNTYSVGALAGLLDNGALNPNQSFNNGSDSVSLGTLVAGNDAAGRYTEYNGTYETFDGGSTWQYKNQ